MLHCNERPLKAWWQQTYRSFFHCSNKYEHAHNGLSTSQTMQKDRCVCCHHAFPKSPISSWMSFHIAASIKREKILQTVPLYFEYQARNPFNVNLLTWRKDPYLFPQLRVATSKKCKLLRSLNFKVYDYSQTDESFLYQLLRKLKVIASSPPDYFKAITTGTFHCKPWKH